MIKIVGTGHVLEKSVRDVEKAIAEENPDIIAVELDFKRFRALEGGGWGPDTPYEEISFMSVFRGLGGGGSLLVLLERAMALIQQDLGRKFGVRPGSEMVAAIRLARNSGKKIALIDRDVEITLNHALSAPIKEKIRLFTRSDHDLELIGNLLGAGIEGILKEENVEKITGELKKTLPVLYSALIDERDRYMAHLLLRLQGIYPEEKILVVVGAGHKRGIESYLKGKRIGDIEKLTEMRPVSRLHTLLFILAIFFVYILMKIEFIRIRK